MPTATQKQKDDFTRTVMSAGARLSLNFVNPDAARLLLTAWGAHESGWGLTRQAERAFNLWNVSAGASWQGKVLEGGDTEYAPGQKGAKRITQQWRVYNSVDAAMLDLLRLLSRSRFVNYREGYEKLSRGEKDFATALGVFEHEGDTVVRVENRENTAGYYTMPRSDYQKALNACIAEVRLIAQRLQLNVSC